MMKVFKLSLLYIYDGNLNPLHLIVSVSFR